MAVVLVLTIVIAGRLIAPVAIIRAVRRGRRRLASERTAGFGRNGGNVAALSGAERALLFQRCSHPPRRSTFWRAV
jgi:hypothetical protein